MAYYDICPYCKATLDPGERCDCQSEKIQKQGYADQLSGRKKTRQVAVAFGAVEVNYGKEGSY